MTTAVLEQIPMEQSLDAKKEAFGKEAFPFMNEMYAAGLRMAGNRQAAEDPASDTFAKAWRAYDQFEKGTNMRAWLYRILTNTYINEYRKKTRQGTPVHIDDYETPEQFYIYNKLAEE